MTALPSTPPPPPDRAKQEDPQTQPTWCGEQPVTALFFAGIAVGLVLVLLRGH